MAFLVKVRSLSIVFGIISIIAIIIIPLPAGFLDFFLAISISISILIILISVYVPKPTDLTTFPTLILLITLFRLSLHIATTRMILSKGHEGADAVSEIVASFGEFVVGGNYVIGVVVFSILVLINFMVVTKGSTRVSEVQARFTLDAMPGKQMAIDADLNAGLIDEQTATKRRQELISEANFYGAMDGSSKFIRGDAIAGIIITLVNIAGGFLIGAFQHDLPMAECAKLYTVLTIGDGLVSQIPGLITSTATAIIITRASKDDENFAEGTIKQLFSNYITLMIVGSILFLFALVPGLPHLSLGFIGVVFLAIGYLVYMASEGKLGTPEQAKEELAGEEDSGMAQEQMPVKSDEELLMDEQKKIDDVLSVELLEIELGYNLIRLADPKSGGALINHVKGLRRNIASTLGFYMPEVGIKDRLQLLPNDYVIKLKGIDLASYSVYPDKFFVMDSGFASEEIEGTPTKEPVFGADALWIDASMKDEAIMRGYQPIDASSVITTHLGSIVRRYAAEFLTRAQVMDLLDRLRKKHAVVVDACLEVCPMGLLQKVLKSLLDEGIPIKDMISILECVTDRAEYVKDPGLLTEYVRKSLARVISSLYAQNGKLYFYLFDGPTNTRLTELLQGRGESYSFAMNIAQTSALTDALIEKSAAHKSSKGTKMLLCVEAILRLPLSSLCKSFGIEIDIIAIDEIAKNMEFITLGSIYVDL